MTADSMKHNFHLPPGQMLIPARWSLPLAISSVLPVLRSEQGTAKCSPKVTSLTGPWLHLDTATVICSSKSDQSIGLEAQDPKPEQLNTIFSLQEQYSPSGRWHQKVIAPKTLLSDSCFLQGLFFSHFPLLCFIWKDDSTVKSSRGTRWRLGWSGSSLVYRGQWRQGWSEQL